jgi:hypothetical protein
MTDLDPTAALTAALAREGIRLRKILDMRCCRCGYDQSWLEGDRQYRVLKSGHLVCAECEAALSKP